jgi:transposase
MRKSYDGLDGIVRNQLGHDLLRGDLYLFTGKDRRRAKVFLFDGTGLCIYMKRTSRGQFAKLRDVDGELRMTMSELALYLEGSELVARETLSPPALRLKDLARFDSRVIVTRHVAARSRHQRPRSRQASRDARAG